ncbi:hypothetical protein HAT86_16730 [Roseovarius gahaiensis]|uniref:SH3 domain-containing protein n=1 Tax=Roseovarius gahaiensis TaxID=2716691 RepID=A0A967ELB6_9RHOB|nr:hypothetical protein [Roseovarius gahaiensis]NHQ76084.1 hypothetical protein [Roseovarius gahaiensis]
MFALHKSCIAPKFLALYRQVQAAKVRVRSVLWGGARDASNSDEFFTVPHRLLNPQGRLGFHAPSLGIDDGQFTADQLNRAFQVALDGIQAVLRLATDQQIDFPPSLLVSMLETPPADMFYVDTIHEANRWKINLHPVAYPTGSPIPALTFACLNAYVFGTEIRLEPLRHWFERILEPQSQYAILRSDYPLSEYFGEMPQSFFEENFTLRVLPMWSFLDAPAGFCIIARDLATVTLWDANGLTHLHPFQFYSPDTRISNLPWDGSGSAERLATESAAAFAQLQPNRVLSCWLTSPTARVTNVNKYVNLRRRPDFSAAVFREVPLGERVSLIKASSMWFIEAQPEREDCFEACQAIGANRRDTTAAGRVRQCIDDNRLWYEITDARGNRGWVSRKFLEEVE